MDEFLRWLEGEAASPALPPLFCARRPKLISVWSRSTL
jgi:hypothetical protein